MKKKISTIVGIAAAAAILPMTFSTLAAEINELHLEAVGDTKLVVELQGSNVSKNDNPSEGKTLKAIGEYEFSIDTSESGFSSAEYLSALPLYVVLEDEKDTIEELVFQVTSLTCDVQSNKGADILNKAATTEFTKDMIDNGAFSLRGCVDAALLKDAMSIDTGSMAAVESVHLTINVTKLAFRSAVTTTTTTTTTASETTTTTIETTNSVSNTDTSSSSSTDITTTTTATSTTVTSAPAERAGDAGIGIAVTGICFAGAALVVFRKRR